mmetsp:Transcript_12001/g.33211  ORF Transcript_12001/g.33211 Transcript_12001/m.33211 type:complete len:251 (+) Transcript_12001:130-882(+)
MVVVVVVCVGAGEYLRASLGPLLLRDAAHASADAEEKKEEDDEDDDSDDDFHLHILPPHLFPELPALLAEGVCGVLHRLALVHDVLKPLPPLQDLVDVRRHDLPRVLDLLLHVVDLALAARVSNLYRFLHRDGEPPELRRVLRARLHLARAELAVELLLEVTEENHGRGGGHPGAAGDATEGDAEVVDEAVRSASLAQLERVLALLTQFPKHLRSGLLWVLKSHASLVVRPHRPPPPHERIQYPRRGLHR